MVVAVQQQVLVFGVETRLNVVTTSIKLRLLSTIHRCQSLHKRSGDISRLFMFRGHIDYQNWTTNRYMLNQLQQRNGTIRDNMILMVVN